MKDEDGSPKMVGLVADGVPDSTCIIFRVGSPLSCVPDDTLKTFQVSIYLSDGSTMKKEVLLDSRKSGSVYRLPGPPVVILHGC